MSRCFPFPPPGYEKTLRLENVTLIAKEKDKEKKHKKDKDKDKKEGNEKDKERSKDRHKEKDKEKHKHKDKDKKNGKKRSRHEKSFDGHRSIVEKVGSSSPQSSCVQEFEQRINFVNGSTASQAVNAVYYDRGQRKPEVLREVASRSNGHITKEQRGNIQTSYPKVNAVYHDRGQRKPELLGKVASRSNGHIANEQRGNIQTNFPKVAFVFGNGAEQRAVQTDRPIESNISKSDEGKGTHKSHNIIKKAEKSTDKNTKRRKGDIDLCTPQTFGYNGVQIGPPKEDAAIKELERRIQDENGATGSQVGNKANDLIERRAQIGGKMANGYAISFSQPKEKSKFGINSDSTENRLKNRYQSEFPKVAIVNNFRVEERGCEVDGAVDMSKKAPTEGMLRNGYSGRGTVDNRKKTQSVDQGQNKPREEEKTKEQADNTVNLSRLGHNGCDSGDGSKQCTSKIGKYTAEAISGKRRESEASGILHDNGTRPNKWQRTVQYSQPVAENGRHLKLGRTITLSASKQGPADGFKLDGEEHKPSSIVSSQPPPVTTKSPSANVMPMCTSLLGATTDSQSSLRKVPAYMGSQESSLVSSKLQLTAGKVNGIIGAHGSPQEPRETVVGQNSAKLQLTFPKVNGTTEAHVSLPVTPKRPSTSEKEKHKDKSKKNRDKTSSKPVPPHPDTKYLSQILSVPKMEELSEFDDAEWLFESKSLLSKEGDTGYDRDGGEQVWAKGFHIDPADVYALPYVIPY